MGHHLLRRITNLTLAFLIAVFSINLSGVLSLQNAYAHDGHGNNGSLKVHEKGTPSGTESNDPKVCKFNFEGFNFDKNQSGYVKVATQSGGVDSLSPSLYPFGPTNNSGDYTAGAYINDGGTFTLPNGQYKATLYGKSTSNPSLPNLNDVKAQSKVFKVVCDITAAAPTQSNPCGTSNDKYTIPTTAGVKYQVKINGIWTDKSAGTYSYISAGNIIVRAISTDNDVDVAQPNQWTFTYTNVTCTTTVATQAPTNHDDNCGSNNDTYTIPTVTGIQYKVNGVEKSAGTYSTNGATSLTITAVAKSGYVLTGITSWTLTFVNQSCVAPTAPTSVDMCGTSDDTYTIPSTTGVIYKVDGITKPAGQYQTSTDVTITAEAADSNYALTGTTLWSQTFDSEKCPVQLTAEGDPTFIDECGTENDSYTIVPADHVIYKIDGQEVAATFYPHASGSVVIVAEPADPDYALVGQTEWTHEFSAASCADITATAVCDRAGVIVTLKNEGDMEGYAWVNGEEVVVDGNSSVDVVVPFTLWKASVSVYGNNEASLLDKDFDCTPGRGGMGGEDPQDPVVPKTPAVSTPHALPQTGGVTNSLQQLLTVIASGIVSYGVTFFLVNRRDLAKK